MTTDPPEPEYENPGKLDWTGTKGIVEVETVVVVSVHENWPVSSVHSMCTKALRGGDTYCR